MKDKAAGFYWTLPVPWAGFRRRSSDVDVAAGESRTIAYQRGLIRRYAKDNGISLIHEAVFMELQPDRGSDAIKADLMKAADICSAENAMLLYVDFGHVHQWRSHLVMNEVVGRLGIPFLAIPAEPAPVDGQMFDPFAHFANWRERQRQWTESKSARVAAAKARASELRKGGLKNPDIARRLNAENIRSASGREWTAESLRKFMKSSFARPSDD